MARSRKTFQAMLSTATMTLLLAATAGCGYVRSGRWDGDPGNWERAFGQRKLPPQWSLVHSRCWRYPHWSYEGGYYFQVRVAAAGRRSLVQPDYIRLDPSRAGMHGPCEPRPAWFAPKGFAEYEVWGARQGYPNYRVLIDPQGSDVFLMDCLF